MKLFLTFFFFAHLFRYVPSERKGIVCLRQMKNFRFSSSDNFFVISPVPLIILFPVSQRTCILIITIIIYHTESYTDFDELNIAPIRKRHSLPDISSFKTPPVAGVALPPMVISLNRFINRNESECSRQIYLTV